jgi:threonine/homoserine/homoserine lactone efflux protein
VIGITIGFFLLFMTAGLGLAGVVHAEPRIQTALKYVGGAYILYLAWRIASAESVEKGAPRARPIGGLQAMLLQWVNPKAWVFAFGALATYSTATGDMIWETSLITVICTIWCTISAVVWSGFGAAIGGWLANPGARRAFNWTMAGLLVLSLVPVFW